MNTFTTMNQSKRLLISAAVTAIVSVFSANPAMAGEFSNGDWYGSFDTTVSYGASWRVDDYDPADVGKSANNPAVYSLGATFYTPAQRAALGRWSSNDDDGDLNYREAGDLITNNFKVTAELDISNGNFGAFFRASAFYDFENEGKDSLSEEAQERVGTDFRRRAATHRIPAAIGRCRIADEQRICGVIDLR